MILHSDLESKKQLARVHCHTGSRTSILPASWPVVEQTSDPGVNMFSRT